MIYTWKDYNKNEMEFVENWLDDKARANTGIDDGWYAEYDYWTNADGQTPECDRMQPGVNYWNKLVSLGDTPIAVVELSCYEGKHHIMEIIVAPHKRSHGHGTAILQELLAHGDQIIGSWINYATSVVFTKNIASRRAFEKTGFNTAPESGDGTLLEYGFK